MKKINFIIKLLVLALFSAVGSISAQTNVNKNFIEYSKEIQERANAGDADAMGIMASWLRTGDVGKKKPEEGAQLAEKSDAMGSAFGAYECATLSGTNNKLKSESLYKKAFPKLLELAKGGDCIAQNKVSSMFGLGLGIEKNPQKALEWLQKSANQGWPPAQFLFGLDYMDGELGLEKNPQKAVEWLQKSAGQGYAPAQASIGLYHVSGELGLEKNPQKAVEWLQKAADQGLSAAQYWVGVLFSSDETGTKNLELAHKYLTEASSSFDAKIANDAKARLQKIEFVFQEKPGQVYKSIGPKVKGLSIGMRFQNAIEIIKEKTKGKKDIFGNEVAILGPFKAGDSESPIADALSPLLALSGVAPDKGAHIQIPSLITPGTIRADENNAVYLITLPPCVFDDAANLPIHDFAQKFMDAYGIPEFKPSEDGENFEYTDPSGVRVVIFGKTKSVQLEKVASDKQIKASFD